ncbi:MAG: hypothetical protein ACI39E_07260 [Acutalibacteraceae bacterium]
MAKSYTPPTDENGNVVFDPLHKLTVKRTGKQIMRLQMLIRVTAVIVSALFLFVLLMYLFSLFSTKAGRFTVRTNDGARGLILSETADFEFVSAKLEADPVDQMDNITYSWMPTDLNDTDGSHNGDNYLAYTFYVKNTGTEDIAYHASLDIEWVKKNVDEAVRVMLYRNGEPTVYAKSGKTGEAEIDPEWTTVPFVNAATVTELQNEAFAVGDIDKYTVVVWLEGEDPECVDDILGGELKMSMSFKVVDLEQPVSV